MGFAIYKKWVNEGSYLVGRFIGQIEVGVLVVGIDGCRRTVAAAPRLCGFIGQFIRALRAVITDTMASSGVVVHRGIGNPISRVYNIHCSLPFLFFISTHFLLLYFHFGDLLYCFRRIFHQLMIVFKPLLISISCFNTTCSLFIDIEPRFIKALCIAYIAQIDGPAL